MKEYREEQQNLFSMTFITVQVSFGSTQDATHDVHTYMKLMTLFSLLGLTRNLQHTLISMIIYNLASQTLGLVLHQS